MIPLTKIVRRSLGSSITRGSIKNSAKYLRNPGQTGRSGVPRLHSSTPTLELLLEKSLCWPKYFIGVFIGVCYQCLCDRFNALSIALSALKPRLVEAA